MANKALLKWIRERMEYGFRISDGLDNNHARLIQKAEVDGLLEISEIDHRNTITYTLTDAGKRALGNTGDGGSDSKWQDPTVLGVRRHIIEWLHSIKDEGGALQGKRTSIAIHEYLAENVADGDKLDFMFVAKSLDSMVANETLEGTSIWGTAAYRYPTSVHSTATPQADSEATVYTVREYGNDKGYGVTNRNGDVLFRSALESRSAEVASILNEQTATLRSENARLQAELDTARERVSEYQSISHDQYQKLDTYVQTHNIGYAGADMLDVVLKDAQSLRERVAELQAELGAAREAIEKRTTRRGCL